MGEIRTWSRAIGGIYLYSLINPGMSCRVIRVSSWCPIWSNQLANKVLFSEENMATQTLTYKSWLQHISLVNLIALRMENLLYKMIPRPWMLLSVGVCLLGLAIPLLMLVEILPASLLLSFTGLGLTTIGGVLYVFFIGDF
jgi:hypothetical protein